MGENKASSKLLMEVNKSGKQEARNVYEFTDSNLLEIKHWYYHLKEQLQRRRNNHCFAIKSTKTHSVCEHCVTKSFTNAWHYSLVCYV